ncbi:hypothetical protein AK973_3605 [Pseudomonas brassicacearum]|nr:hypothetical protein AK973_3605 [Pseudomonas brassicacearum]
MADPQHKALLRFRSMSEFSAAYSRFVGASLDGSKACPR